MIIANASNGLDLMLGGLRLRLETTDPTISLNYVSEIEPPLEAFIDQEKGCPDIELLVKPAYTPQDWLEFIPADQPEPTFYLDDARWCYYQLSDGKHCFIYFHYQTGYFNNLILLDPDYKQGLLLFNPTTRKIPLDVGSLLAEPLSKILMAGRLMKEQGIILHASAIKTAKGVLIFSGPSGAGKTTLCRISQQFADCEQLCDERIVIRANPTSPTGYQAYGTPWPGQGNIYNRIDGPLLGLFLIRHFTENQMEPTTGLNAVSWLMRETFPPSWHPEVLSFLLDFYTRLVKEIPCFKYGFVPTLDAITFARDTLEV